MTVATETWKLAGVPSAAQVGYFRENGYLKFGRIFERPEIDTLRAHVDDDRRQ